MSHKTCIGLPPSGLMVYMPSDVAPSSSHREQLFGSVKMQVKNEIF